MEEPKNERAFAKEGQLIKAVEELKPGDIIGINHTNPGNYQDARIYFGRFEARFKKLKS
jgi:TusA-related sulfurtransferase